MRNRPAAPRWHAGPIRRLRLWWRRCARAASGARRRSCGLASRLFAGGLHLAVARAAVDGAFAARHEGHLGHLAAIGAGSGVHLAWRLAAEAGEVAITDVAVILFEGALACAAGGAARLAAGGLVHQALVRVELLLARGEYEVGATVATRDLFVGK